LAAESSRPSVASRTESRIEPVQERSAGGGEVAAFLGRAVEPEQDHRGPAGLREVEDVSDERLPEGIGAAIAGAPLRRVIERVVAGEIGPEDHERLAQEVRDVLSPAAAGSRGTLPQGVSALGRSLTLSGFTGTSSVEFDVAPRDGRTFIRLSADRSQLAGGLFGGIVGGIGGGFGVNVGWMIPTLLHLPWVAGLAGAGLVVLGGYALARGIFVTTASALDRKLEALANRLAAIAQQATERRSLPSAAS
jgi:hypothetical protein